MLAEVDPWKWQPHPEVWALILGIVGLGYFAARVIGPKVVPPGEQPVSRTQRRWFVLAVVLLLVASDWPMHDIGERYLYSVHMVQHLVISFLIAPIFLLATPTWLARLVVLDRGPVSRAIRWLARPVPAGLIFSALTVFLHWGTAVRLSVENGPFHYTMHLLLFGTALLMWMPVAGPIPELRLSLPGQMIYLFLQSIIPTVPGGWLTFAENPVYKVYDHSARLWNIGVIDDQQAAGAFMKIAGGFFLWALITVLFFRWAASHQRSSGRDGNRPVILPDGAPGGLTFESVAAEFERLGPAPRERVPGGLPRPGDERAN
jgi:putative membrane protein